MKLFKLLKYTFLFLIVQILLVLLPMIIENNIPYITEILFIINAIICWYIIKQVEMLYYKKYNKLSSMLYNICPLIGICLLFGISYYFTKSEDILLLMKYYIPLFVVIYFINLIYVLIKIKHK